ncbi:uncharacterized protein K444DRAFT_621455 [Hyaloscypha bicolor E]|uniref:Uncharacterized protein n=1 Tax=Hyaloscypha bicolor E TaxID=1095630 RepID=A0A2J6SNH1_9HELO|nr:uncharacterized protein K444DRAFT_621455 [Hyaloscypha bicolor E]PMD52321.1 hypothetical protein K444DRAFT_621455 [Hyaloscypha bicolor E]
MAKRSSWLILRDSIIPTGPIRTSFERSQTGSLKPISSGSGLLALSTCTELSTFALGIKNLRMSHKLCGEQGLGSVVLATTMWSLCLAADASRREDQLVYQNDLWIFLVGCGPRVPARRWCSLRAEDHRPSH